MSEPMMVCEYCGACYFATASHHCAGTRAEESNDEEECANPNLGRELFAFAAGVARAQARVMYVMD